MNALKRGLFCIISDGALIPVAAILTIALVDEVDWKEPDDLEWVFYYLAKVTMTSVPE